MSEFKIYTIDEMFVQAEVSAKARVALGKTLRSDARGITINGYYFIEWPRISTAEQLAGWLWHLAEKDWWDNQFTIDLINAVHNHNPSAVRIDT